MQTNTITQEIRDAHKRIIGLMRQLEAVSARTSSMEEPVFRQLRMETAVLAKLEQEILFPSTQALDSTELAGATEQTLEGHRKIHSLLENLKPALVADDSSRQTELLRQTGSELELLLRQESEEMLPLIEEALPDRLFELGTWFKARRDELLAQPEYSDAQPQITQNPGGGEQMRVSGQAHRKHRSA